MEEVTISIGMGSITHGVVKAVRGKSLPLRISKDSSAKKILEEAYKKRMAYDRAFRTDRSYKFYYPDGTDVITLPGSEEEFTLEKYKEDLGKAWGRITLLLCPDPENSLLNLDENITDQDEGHGVAPDNVCSELCEKYGKGEKSDETCPRCGWIVEGIHSEGVHVGQNGAMKIYSDGDIFECPECFYKCPVLDDSTGNECHLEAGNPIDTFNMLDSIFDLVTSSTSSATCTATSLEMPTPVESSNSSSSQGTVPSINLEQGLENLPERDALVHRCNILKGPH